jgi:hypothetical protein
MSKPPALRPSALTVEARKDLVAKILDAYEQDKTIDEQAAELGVSNVTVYKLIVSECPEEWKAVQSARAERLYAEARQALADAATPFDLMKAEKRAKSAQWELERLNARMYGQTQPTTVQVPIQINIGIDRSGHASSDSNHD